MALLLAVTLVSLGLGLQVVPIPVVPEGYVLGSANSTKVLDVFYDHLCSDSAAAFPGLWSYWQSNQNWLKLVIHIFPLPYHHYTFMVSQAGKYVQLNYPQLFISYTEYMFNNQETYLYDALNWTFPQVQQQLAQDTYQATGIPTSEVLTALNNTAVNWATRVSWKYATTRGMPGTPNYLLNGVWAPDASVLETVEDWANWFGSAPY